MREDRVQELMTRFSRLNIPPTTVQWLAVAVFGLVFVVAIVMVLAAGLTRTEAPTQDTAGIKTPTLKKTLNDRLSANQAPAVTASPKKQKASVMPPPREGALRIVSWDLSTLPAMEGGRADKESQASWRTSFGSERSTAPESLTGGARYDLKADVILLQGISDATLLRRYFFPARDWHLIVSRQKLTDVAMQADPASAAVGITGVAIRVREGLRITAREYYPRIGGEQLSEPNAGLLAGTAVRVSDRGRTVWLASFAVPPDCTETPSSCTARARLSEWQQSKREREEAVVVGGMLAPSTPGSAATAPSQSSECERQRLNSNLESSNLPNVTEDDLAGPGSGCAVAIDLSPPTQ
jgi:hypothetical protein